MIKRGYVSWAVSVGLIAILLVNSAEALYLGGKGWLAQHLLLSAWQNSEENQQATKPWPWADIQTAGLLQIPAQGIRQVALSGHSGEALAFGPGVVESEGALMLAGHRDSHFQFARHLQLGDTVIWQGLGQEARAYHITALEVINSAEQEAIIPPANSLLMVTCFPFDATTSGGPLRYVIVASPLARF